MTTVTHVEHLLYGGRALVGFTDEGERVADPLAARPPRRALNGLLLIGWSASFTYISMERFWRPGAAP